MPQGPNIASHWIQAHGATGDVMAQRVTDGPNVLLDTSIKNEAAADFNNDFNPNGGMG
jgi:hypothetical protein